MKKLCKLLVVIVLLMSMNVAVTAEAKNKVIQPNDFGEPIEISTYEEEDGSVVTEKIYFLPEGNVDGISCYSTSGRGWYKNEKEYKWSNGTKMKYYAQGYFVWGNGNVKVSNTSGGVSNVPKKVKISQKKLDSGTGRYAYIFNKYAYVEYSFTATNEIGLSTDFSVMMRISESGNNI